MLDHHPVQSETLMRAQMVPLGCLSHALADDLVHARNRLSPVYGVKDEYLLFRLRASHNILHVESALYKPA